MTNAVKPPVTYDVRVQDIVTLTARLAQILAEEVDLLGAMKVNEIEALQQEKLFLIAALDAQRKYIDKNPQMLDGATPQEKSQMREIIQVFNNVLEENHRRLKIAREVNHRIVQAITHVVRQNTKSRAYDGKGITPSAAFDTLSVTLNRMV